MERLASVDSLRGLTVAAMLFVNNPADWKHVVAPFRHAEWHGCTPTDLIFPLFLFIVGVSISLSAGPRLEAGVAPSTLHKGIWLRALRLFALGVALNVVAFLLLDLPALRIMAVLQRIAICYAIVALVALHASARAQWLLAGALLLGWWAILAVGGSYEEGSNIASAVDSRILGRHAFEFDAATGRAHDPEGLLSTLGALATTLLGVRAGDWLRRGAVRQIVIAGVAAVLLAAAWSLLLPFNKNLWTSSFSLFTAGAGFLLTAMFHVLVDRRGWPPPGRSFGVNAIAMFAGSMMVAYVLIGLGLLRPLYQDGLAGWLSPLAGPYVASHAYALLFLLVFWLIARRLDARGLYFRI
jgi:predicted acyltransferase